MCTIIGGEPLVRKDIVAMMNKINKQNTRVILNSNVMLAERLLQAPKVEQVDAIYASLHTTKESDFKKHLGIGGGAQRVMVHFWFYSYNYRTIWSCCKSTDIACKLIIAWVPTIWKNLLVLLILHSRIELI